LAEIRRQWRSVCLIIGQLLQLNDIRFEEMIREATYTKAAADEVLEQIEKLDPR